MEGTMRIYQIPSVLFLIFPQIRWKDKAAADQVYLTFDDGPDPIVTPKILNILEKEQAMVSFFVIGQKAQRHHEIVQQMNQLGHTVGIHAFEHKRLFYQAKTYLIEQIRQSKFIVEQIIQQAVSYFRPPYGIFSPRLIRVCQLLDLNLVMWSMMSYDFDKRVSDKFILKFIEKKTSPGDFIVFHDGHGNSERTVSILASAIKRLKEKGLKIIAMPK